MPMKMTLLATAATGLLAIAAPAHATTTINLGGSAGSGSSGNSIVFTGGGTTVTASGWSIDNAGNAEATRTVQLPATRRHRLGAFRG